MPTETCDPAWSRRAIAGEKLSSDAHYMSPGNDYLVITLFHLQPNRVEVLPGGLACIPEGLERLKNGEVSGKKLIVRPHETA